MLSHDSLYSLIVFHFHAKEKKRKQKGKKIYLLKNENGTWEWWEKKSHFRAQRNSIKCARKSWRQHDTFADVRLNLRASAETDYFLFSRFRGSHFLCKYFKITQNTKSRRSKRPTLEQTLAGKQINFNRANNHLAIYVR